MTRYRSREAETEDVNPRRLQRGAVQRQHLTRWSVGHDELAPGVVGPGHLQPNVIERIIERIGDGNGIGETITVEATFEIPVDGAEIIWDTLVSKQGFDGVTIPSAALPVTYGNAYYDLAEVELAWSDWRRFATVEARVNGTAIRSWTAQRGAETVPFTVPLGVRTAEDEVSVFVDHGDTVEHVVTARATLQLIDGAVGPTGEPRTLVFELSADSLTTGFAGEQTRIVVYFNDVLLGEFDSLPESGNDGYDWLTIETDITPQWRGDGTDEMRWRYYTTPAVAPYWDTAHIRNVRVENGGGLIVEGDQFYPLFHGAVGPSAESGVTGGGVREKVEFDVCTYTGTTTTGGDAWLTHQFPGVRCGA